MNIIVTDESPFQSARNLDDIRVVTQIRDVVKILSAVGYAEGKTGFFFCDELNDPVVRWTRNQRANLYWVSAYGYGLLSEFEERFDTSHKASYILDKAIKTFGYERPNVSMFQNNARNVKMNLSFSHIQDVPTAYRLMMDGIWNEMIRQNKLDWRSRLPKWTNIEPPEWYICSKPSLN